MECDKLRVRQLMPPRRELGESAAFEHAAVRQDREEQQPGCSLARTHLDDQDTLLRVVPEKPAYRWERWTGH